MGTYSPLAENLGTVRRYTNALGWRDWSFLAALVLVGGYVYVADLGAYTLAGWDEGTYATAAYHAVADGHWLVPHTYWIANTHDVTLQPFLHKPPLAIWLQALSMSVFGITEFAARLPAALAVILTGVVVYVLGRARISRFAGFVGAVAWYTTPGVYAASNGGRFAATDTLHVLFGTLFVALTWLAVSRDRPRLLVPTCVAAALLVLTKGFAAGLFVLVVAPLVLANRSLFKTRAMALGVGLFSLLVVPWVAFVTVRHGETFIQQAFLEQVLGRATGGIGVTTPGGLFPFMRYPYIQHFFSLFDPWVYWLLPGVVALGALVYRRRDDADLRTLLVVTYWAGLVLTFFTLFGNHQWYIMPMYVPCALLVGWVVESAVAWEREGLAAVGVGSLLFVALSPRFSGISPLASERFAGLHGGVWSELVSGPVVLGVLLSVLACLVAIRLVRTGDIQFPAHNRTLAAAPVVVSLLLVTVFVTPPASMGTLLHNQHEMGTTVRAEVPEDATVYIQTRVPDATNMFPFEFYSRADFASASRYDLYTDDSIQYAVVTQATLETLRRPHRVLVRRNIQSGNGPKPLAVVAFTGSFADYDPGQPSVSDARPNLLANPGFDRGLDGWWLPPGENVTEIAAAVVDGDPAATLSVPADARRLPLAQRVAVRKGQAYRIGANTSGDVAVSMLWYDGTKEPENLVRRRTVRASGLPETVTARGSQLSLRFRPVGREAVVHDAVVRRVPTATPYAPVGPNVVRNGAFADGLAEWWANPWDNGTQVSVRKGTVQMRTPPGAEPIPIGQQVVVDPTKRYWVDLESDDFADLVLVWFDEGNDTSTIETDVIPAANTPTVVEAKSHLVAVRVRPAATNVSVQSVSVSRAVNVTALPE